ncbi:hypothetical protein [Rhodococcus qingshengii]|uniref:hypothetical protein n=1 Tax=Rhodococcus qingshengii TaxID=334542 RepID=UPI00116120AC|nr:hypothetical protein [Rhodococcus qingshengii]MCZ4546187.1 hypothetical protein [Rhodococcus qingshengii]UGQ53334.1 hypothetical protein LRL17_06310 [Rhodococcus qingshengii]
MPSVVGSTVATEGVADEGVFDDLLIGGPWVCPADDVPYISVPCTARVPGTRSTASKCAFPPAAA